MKNHPLKVSVFQTSLPFSPLAFPGTPRVGRLPIHTHQLCRHSLFDGFPMAFMVKSVDSGTISITELGWPLFALCSVIVD